MIRDSGHFDYDSKLDEFYGYGKYGHMHLKQSQGMFTEQGYISYHGILSLDALMMEAPTEQFQEEQGEDLEMGGGSLEAGMRLKHLKNNRIPEAEIWI